MAWKFPHELAESAGKRGWVNLGDIQPPRPASTAKYSKSKADRVAGLPPLASFAGKPCAYCAAAMTQTPAWPSALLDTDTTRDHAFPKCQGFRLDDFDGANRIICCSRCNYDKGARDIVEWHLRLHVGGDPRAPVVFAAIEALWKIQQITPSFPAGIRAKLELAHMHALQSPGDLMKARALRARHQKAELQKKLTDAVNG